MKLLPLFFCLLAITATAQTTYAPTSISNEDEWRIDKIAITNDYTIVYFSVYTTNTDYTFFFHRDIYIQQAGNAYGKKYYAREFVNHELHRKYRLDPYERYHFQLKFDKLPPGLVNISIIEPKVEGYNPWYWKYINISNPARRPPPRTSTSPIERFFKHDGVATLAQFAHPSDTYLNGSYTIYADQVVVEINYAEGFYTKLSIKRSNGFFTGIRVLKDENTWPAFWAVTLIKELVEAAMEESEQEEKEEAKSLMERELAKAFDEFDGEDLALFALNLEWMEY